MKSWAPMAPSKPGGPSSSSKTKAPTAIFSAVLKPSKPSAQSQNVGPLVGRWPESILLRIIRYLPVSEIPNVARVSRALASLVRDEDNWQWRCQVLGLSEEEIRTSTTAPRKESHSSPARPKHTPVIGSSSLGNSNLVDDDFGDFAAQSGVGGGVNGSNNDVFEDVDFGEFNASSRPNGASKNEDSLIGFDDMPLPSHPTAGSSKSGRTTGFFALTPSKAQTQRPTYSTRPTKTGPFYQAYKTHHLALIHLCHHLRASPSPSSTLSLLFPLSPLTSLPPTLTEQADKLLILLRFLSPDIQPLRDWGFLRQALLAAADRFDSTCLVAFEVADSKNDEEGMRIAADSSWKVFNEGGGGRDQWECGRVWVEKREVFYETGKWDPLENIVKAQTPTGAMVRQLDFTPMDAFITHVLEAFRIDANRAVRVFPMGARVILSFCERVANDVIGEYVQPLLGQTRIVSQDLFLQATAATFVQAWKLVGTVMEVLEGTKTTIKQSIVEDVIYHMFEVNMDEYLDEETEWVKRQLDGICAKWTKDLGASDPGARAKTVRGAGQPTFLNSSNPDQVKRNVLAGFKDVLLLPVTIVPRTVTFGVNAIVSGGSSAVNGLSMLNPQKWAGNSGENRQVVKTEAENGKVIFETKEVVELDEKDDVSINEKDSTFSMTNVETALPTPSTAASPNMTTTASQMNGAGQLGKKGKESFDKLQLLVSLDIALELIHADRESLKRTETFAGYPGKYGHKVKESIEEIFILMLKSAGDMHIAPGFRVATSQMSTYKPDEHEETTSVAPLLQFFELVHVGDTVQSMIQVYFDKDLSKYVDKTDFLNGVMREKKRFESVLDDAVAAGLNAGIEVLMNQVEHIIMVKTGPREYYPVDGAAMDLGPTEGCREAIACLEMHCNLLRGSTSKEVLEVFYQEVGIRLQGILQRHLKRQIISLEGGFQIIADLNAYHNFIASLKQQRITEDFANLKMLGHVYIVSDAKDLAQIVRDVTRYGGTFRPEDIYEFIQRRADWKKIEKTVDKAMYALSVRDDCVIM